LDLLRTREVGALVRLLAALGGKALPDKGVARLKEIPDSREYRDAATDLLADARLVVAVDWRSPPDEVVADLRPVTPPKFRRAVLARLSDDLSSEEALQVVAGRLERQGGPRLAYIDQTSDTFMVLCVAADVARLARAVQAANLGHLKFFPRRPEPNPKRDRADRPSVAVERVPNRATTEPKTWRALLDHLGVTTDRGVLLHVTLNGNSRKKVAAFAAKAPKPVRGTLLALLALLDGRRPDPGDVRAEVDALGYWGSLSGTQAACIGRLLDVAAGRVDQHLLTGILRSLDFPVHREAARAFVVKLGAERRAQLEALVARGFASRSADTLAAAATAAGALRLAHFESRLRELVRSGPPLAQAPAKEALAALRSG
jgi:hypothetical protein